MIFFGSKIAFYLSLGFHKGRPSYSWSLSLSAQTSTSSTNFHGYVTLKVTNKENSRELSLLKIKKLSFFCPTTYLPATSFFRFNLKNVIYSVPWNKKNISCRTHFSLGESLWSVWAVWELERQILLANFLHILWHNPKED